MAGSEKQEFKRGYRACYGCRKRKVKCIFAENSPHNSSCERCKRELKECVIPPSTNRGGIANVLAGRAKKRAQEEILRKSKERKLSRSLSQSPGIGTALSAAIDSRLVSSGAPSGAPSELPPEVIHGQQHSLAPGAIATHILFDEIPHHSPIPTPPVLSHLNRSTDNSAASASPPRRPSQLPTTSASGYRRKSLSKQGVPSGSYELRPPPPGVPLSETCLVSEGIVTEKELIVLHEFYMDRLNPFFPYLPDSLGNLDSISSMPFFLSVLCCTSIHHFVTSLDLGIHVSPERASVERQIVTRRARLYEAAWNLVNTFLGFRLVLFELPDGQLATLMGLIMMAQWGIAPVDKLPDHLSPDERIHYSARRGDRICLTAMVLSSTLMDLIGVENVSSKAYVALKMMGIALTSRINRQLASPTFIVASCPEGVVLLDHDQAKLELLRITALASKLLYQSPMESADNVYTGQHIFLLNAMKPHLELWTLKYHKFLSPQEVVPGNYWSFCEIGLLFHHLRIFIYRLALPPVAQSGQYSRLAGYHSCESFLFSAIESAKEILRLFETIHQEAFVRFLPPAWVSQILHATTFLIKALIFCPITCHGEADISDTLDRIANVSRILLDSRAGLSIATSHYTSVLLSAATSWKGALSSMGSQCLDNQHTQTPDEFIDPHSVPPVPPVHPPEPARAPKDAPPTRAQGAAPELSPDRTGYSIDPPAQPGGLSDQDFHELSTRLADLMDDAAAGCILFPPY